MLNYKLLVKFFVITCFCLCCILGWFYLNLEDCLASLFLFPCSPTPPFSFSSPLSTGPLCLNRITLLGVLLFDQLHTEVCVSLKFLHLPLAELTLLYDDRYIFLYETITKSEFKLPSTEVIKKRTCYNWYFMYRLLWHNFGFPFRSQYMIGYLEMLHGRYHLLRNFIVWSTILYWNWLYPKIIRNDG